MIQNITLTKLCLISLLLFSISSVHTYTSVSFGGTNVEWIIAIFQLLTFSIIIKKYCEPIQYKILNPVKYYLLWNIICVIIGVFKAENYWDWKALITNTFPLLMALVVYPLTNTFFFKRVFNFYFYKILPFFIILAFVIVPDGYGFFLVPISFFILFFPLFNTKIRIILLFLTLIVMFADLGARSSVIKFSIPIILSAAFYFKSYLTIKFFNSIRLIFLILPIFLFTLGVTGVFNIFNIGDYIPDELTKKSKKEGEVVDENLKVDTRTFLYEEVLSSAIKHKYIFIGRSPARGNDSEYFGWTFESQIMGGRHERIGNEVAILNVFTWTGLVGVVLYFLIFSKATYLAINYSNNYFSKLAGIYLSFRWSYAWVEDINSFTLNYFMIWSIIAFCLSLNFRKMTDEEINIWVKSVFNINKELVTK